MTNRMPRHLLNAEDKPCYDSVINHAVLTWTVITHCWYVMRLHFATTPIDGIGSLTPPEILKIGVRLLLVVIVHNKYCRTRPNVTERHGVTLHALADDTHLYLHCRRDDMASSALRLERTNIASQKSATGCLPTDSSWMLTKLGCYGLDIG